MADLRVFYIFALTAFYANGATLKNINERIIGGEDAKEGEFPYQIALKLYGSFRCGGTVINDNFVLTAAHCIADPPVDPKFYEVIAGTRERESGNGQTRKAMKVIVHEKFNLKTVHDDIALIQLANPLELNANVQPLELPAMDTPEGSELMITGWGQDANPGSPPLILKKMKTYVSNLAECNETILEQDHLTLTDKQICVFAKPATGVCYGDSGGPLASENKYIIGVTSMNIKNCALGYPDVFTRVYKYVDWILKHIQT